MTNCLHLQICRAWFVLLILAVSGCGASTQSLATSVIETTTWPASVTLTATSTPKNFPVATFIPMPIIHTPTASSTLLPSIQTPTATSQAEHPPSPGIKFSSNRSYIKVGMCVVFTWEVENAKKVYFYVEEEPWEINAVSVKDSREECRTETTTYYLRVLRPDNTIEIREIRIPVEPMPGL
jgi:hypothetical protein